MVKAIVVRLGPWQLAGLEHRTLDHQERTDVSLGEATLLPESLLCRQIFLATDGAGQRKPIPGIDEIEGALKAHQLFLPPPNGGLRPTSSQAWRTAR
jgi:hypothetical protein